MTHRKRYSGLSVVNIGLIGLFFSAIQGDSLPKSNQPPRNQIQTGQQVLDKDSLNTAVLAGYLSEMEKHVIYQMNLARSDPPLYAERYLKPIQAFFNGKLLELPNRTAIETNEGLKALKECIAVMKKTQPLSLLNPQQGLSRAAGDHAADIGTHGLISHTGSDGSTPFDRMERYGQWKKAAAENIDYGSQTAEEIVYSLLVDDGIASRGHRNTLLNKDYHYTGVSIHSHRKYGMTCVITYAGFYQDRKSDSKPGKK